MNRSPLLLSLTACAFLQSAAVAQPAPAPARREASCIAAVRDKPTLNKRVFKDAAFRMVERDLGPDPDPDRPAARLFLRAGEETAHIARGIDLKVRLGGCESHSNTYEFSLAGMGPPATDSRYWLNRTADLVSTVQRGNIDQAVRLDLLAKALRGAARAGKSLSAGGEYYGEIRVAEAGGFDVPGDETFALRVLDPVGGRVVSVSYYIGL